MPNEPEDRLTRTELREKGFGYIAKAIGLTAIVAACASTDDQERQREHERRTIEDLYTMRNRLTVYLTNYLRQPLAQYDDGLGSAPLARDIISTLGRMDRETIARLPESERERANFLCISIESNFSIYADRLLQAAWGQQDAEQARNDERRRYHEQEYARQMTDANREREHIEECHNGLVDILNQNRRNDPSQDNNDH